MGNTLFPAWADTHTRTATCRALGYIGTTTDVLTLVYTSLCKKNPFGIPHCDSVELRLFSV